MFRFAAVAVLLAAPVLAQQPYELKTEGDSITLTIDDDGVPMVDFVKLAQRMTGRVFTFKHQDIAAADPVKLIGKFRMKKDAFFPFFQTMLHLKGFAILIHDNDGAEVTEIVSLPGAAHHSKDDARYVPAAELDKHKTDDAMILTSIPLAHVAPQLAIDGVHAALAATANGALLGKSGKALLVQGTGADVYCVARMVHLIDVPPLVVSVVPLEHAKATKLVAGLKVLVAGRQPAVLVIAHESANALVLSGPRPAVEEAVEVVGLLDQAAAKKKGKQDK